MSKVICDVCGTTYAETAAQCPICGSARNTTTPTIADSTQSGEESGAYTYVKGGRFSKNNVRKRGSGKEVRRNTGSQKPAKNEEPNEGGGNKILIAIVIILLLAIVAVATYIGICYLVPSKQLNLPGQNNQTPGGTTVPSTVQRIPCTSLVLDPEEHIFASQGSSVLLNVTILPENTTDTVRFESTNTAVATVDETTGMVTGVGGGEAIIKAYCGDQVDECKIVCTFGGVLPPPTTTVPPVTLPVGVTLELKYKDFSISAQYPNPVGIYKTLEGVAATDITWSVEDPTVVAVSDKGVVSAVGRGSTKVWAQLGDQRVSCTVHVQFDPQPPTVSNYKINLKDVMIDVDETFSLVLTDSVGAKVNVEWIASEEGYVNIDGSKIKGLAHTQDLANKYITVSCTHEGEEFSCIVRIKRPAETEG